MTTEPEEEPRRLVERRRQLERVVADGGLQRMGRRAQRWAVVGTIALVGCALLVQGLFTVSTALTAEDLPMWSPFANGVSQVIAGAALLALSWWLVQAAVPEVRGLPALVALVLVSAPPWGWMFGDAGHIGGMVLLIGVGASAWLVYRSSRATDEVSGPVR